MNLREGWNVLIRRGEMRADVGIYIIRRDNGRLYYLRQGGEAGPVECIHEEGTDMVPFLRVSALDSDLLKELAHALEDFGVKTKSDEHLGGKVEAMSEHLKDMRRLVFKDFPDTKSG